MRRLVSLLLIPLSAALVTIDASGHEQNVPLRHAFNIVEASIGDMQAALESGRLTSRELVLLHMQRIAQKTSSTPWHT